MFIKFNHFYRFKKFNESINESINSDIVDRRALSKIRKAFTQILTNFNFFADLLFNLKIMEVPESFCPTMCTDGKSIGYNPKFVHELSEEEVVFVIIHEIMHNANFHFDRQGGRHPKVWNYAGDYSINLLINDMANDSKILKPPKKILLDEKYRDLSAEQIYDIIYDEMKKQSGQGRQGGQGGQGSGQGGQSDQGECDTCGGEGEDEDGNTCPDCNGTGKKQGAGDDISDKLPDISGSGALSPDDIKDVGSIDKVGKEVYSGSGSEEEKEGDDGQGNVDIDKANNSRELRKIWKKIRQQAATKSRGVGSSGMDRWIKKTTKAKVNWRTELRKFVNSAMSELDYGFFNRRFIYRGDYLPGPKQVDKSMFVDVVIAIDTSGSITQDTLNKFGAELMKLFSQYQIQRCHVIWCDSEIPGWNPSSNPKNPKGVQTFERVDKSFKLEKLKPAGGGGTSFGPPFEWVQKNLLKKGRQPAFFLYFTDAYGDAPNPHQYGIKQYVKRTMWIITDNLDGSNLKFGKKIYLDSQVL